MNREIGARIKDYLDKDPEVFLKRVIQKHKRKFEDNLTRELNFKRDPLATVDIDHALDISSEDHKQNEKEVPMELVLSKKEETENQIKKDTEAKNKTKTKSTSEFESQKRAIRSSARSPYPQNPEPTPQPVVDLYKLGR